MSCRVRLDAAVGQVSAELLCPYPPGVPVAVPGEILDQSTIDQLQAVLRAGGTVTGASDSTLETIAVIDI